MKRNLLLLLVSAMGLLVFESCEDKDYNWDNIDKKGVFNLPTVPVGSLDTLEIKGLMDLFGTDEIKLPNMVGGKQLGFTDTVKNLFDEDVIKTFFYDGATQVSIESKVDARFMTGVDTCYFGMRFHVLGEDNNIISGVKIPDIEIKYVRDNSVITDLEKPNFVNQEISLIFKEEYMKYMKDARHLRMVISFKTIAPAAKNGDFVLLKELRLNAGSMAFDVE